MESGTPSHVVAPSEPGTHNSVFANNAAGALLASFLARDASSGNTTTSNGAALHRYNFPTPAAKFASHETMMGRQLNGSRLGKGQLLFRPVRHWLVIIQRWFRCRRNWRRRSCLHSPCTLKSANRGKVDVSS